MQLRSLVVATIFALMLAGSARAALPPGVEPTPSLDELASQVRDLRASVIQLQIANGQLRREVTALNTHTHSLGFRSIGGAMSMVKIHDLRMYLNSNDTLCRDCLITLQSGQHHSEAWISGPPILAQP